jgi:hypothetical protein
LETERVTGLGRGKERLLEKEDLPQGWERVSELGRGRERVKEMVRAETHP